jgi:hypothetical protein
MYVIGVLKHIRENNMNNTFVCRYCQKVKPVLTNGGIGYGLLNDIFKSMICYDCGGLLDKREMLMSGHSKKLPLYLSKKVLSTDDCSYKQYQYTISNWTGSLSFPVNIIWKRKHNWWFVGKVTFVRFIGPDGKVWSGKQMGGFNTIVHCKRTKLSHINA